MGLAGSGNDFGVIAKRRCWQRREPALICHCSTILLRMGYRPQLVVQCGMQACVHLRVCHMHDAALQCVVLRCAVLCFFVLWCLCANLRVCSVRCLKLPVRNMQSWISQSLSAGGEGVGASGHTVCMSLVEDGLHLGWLTPPLQAWDVCLAAKPSCARCWNKTMHAYALQIYKKTAAAAAG